MCPAWVGRSSETGDDAPLLRPQPALHTCNLLLLKRRHLVWIEGIIGVSEVFLLVAQVLAVAEDDFGFPARPMHIHPDFMLGADEIDDVFAQIAVDFGAFRAGL